MNLISKLTNYLKKPQPAKHSELSIRKIIKDNLFFGSLLVFLVILVYFGSLGNEFVSDDKGLLQRSSEITKLHYIFVDPLGFIRNLLYASIYKICGLQASCFRGLNILLHLGNTLLLFLIAAKLVNVKVAKISSAIFAVHPILTEAVTWITGGTYAQYSFFFLLAFLFYIVSAFASKKADWKSTLDKYYLLSLGTFLLGLFTSNRLMALFLIFYVFEFVYGDLKNNFRRLIPFTLLGTFWFVFYAQLLPGRIEQINTANNSAGSFYNPLYQIPDAISSYLIFIFNPDKLSFSHAVSYQLTLNSIIFFLFLFGWIYSFFKNRVVFFWLSFFLVTLAITLSPFKISWVVAERYVYLGTAAIIVVSAIFYAKLLDNQRAKTFWIAVLVLIVTILGMRTITRNKDWQNEESLALATARVSPQDPVAHNYLGLVYINRQQYDQAITEFQKTLNADSKNFEALVGMATSYQMKKQTPEAIFFNLKLLEVNPRSIIGLQHLAEIYYNLKDFEKALPYALKEVELMPENSTLYFNVADLYHQLKDDRKAKEYLEKAIVLNPENKSAKKLLEEIKPQ